MTDWTTIGNAIIAYTGWGTTSYPKPDERRVIANFGLDVAQQLLPLVRKCYNDFFASNANLQADLVEMERMASEDFVRSYPWMPRTAVAAMAWCYSFAHK